MSVSQLPPLTMTALRRLCRRNTTARGRVAFALATLPLVAVGLAGCEGGSPTGLRVEENEGSFVATVSGMRDTTFAGEAYFSGLQLGATLVLKASGPAGEPSFSVSGGWQHFTQGAHPFGPGFYPSYIGHGQESWTPGAGTLTITERAGDKIAGSLEAWMRTSVNVGGTWRSDSVRIHAIFESDGIIAP